MPSEHLTWDFEYGNEISKAFDWVSETNVREIKSSIVDYSLPSLFAYLTCHTDMAKTWSENTLLSLEVLELILEYLNYDEFSLTLKPGSILNFWHLGNTISIPVQ
jgi:hypothetical protein